MVAIFPSAAFILEARPGCPRTGARKKKRGKDAEDEMEKRSGAVIRLEGVTKRYGEITAADGVSFTLDGAGVYGLLGPNGAGKTTTMNIMTGCLAPTEGVVSYDGVSILERPLEVKRRIGYLPEQPPLYPELTPREYLRFVADARGVDGKHREAAVSHALGAAGADKVADRLIAQLSKGYRQRVGVAMALVGDGDVIILDEPMAGLDPLQITEIRDLIRQLGEHRTVLLSSHILTEVRNLATRVLILSHGRLTAQGTPAELAASLNGGVTLTLTARTDERGLRRALNGVKGVRSLHIRAGEKRGTVSAEIRAGRDITERVSNALMERRIPVTRLDAREMSLEEVFLDLTEKDEAKPAGKEGGHDGDL